MNRFVGSLDLLLGALFVFLAGLALSGSPDAFERLSAEPEDFWGLLFLAVLCAAIGAVAVLVGLTLIRGDRVLGRISRRAVSMLTLGVVAVMVLLAIVGFLPDDPGSNELRLLLLPAAVLGASYILLRREAGEATT